MPEPSFNAGIKGLRKVLVDALVYLDTAFHDRLEHGSVHRANESVWGQAEWGVAKWGKVTDYGLIGMDTNANRVKCTKDIQIKKGGYGMIVRTPDETKAFRIRVDNAGTIVSEQVK